MAQAAIHMPFCGGSSAWATLGTACVYDIYACGVRLQREFGPNDEFGPNEAAQYMHRKRSQHSSAGSAGSAASQLDAKVAAGAQPGRDGRPAVEEGAEPAGPDQDPRRGERGVVRALVEEERLRRGREAEGARGVARHGPTAEG